MTVMSSGTSVLGARAVQPKTTAEPLAMILFQGMGVATATVAVDWFMSADHTATSCEGVSKVQVAVHPSMVGPLLKMSRSAVNPVGQVLSRYWQVSWDCGVTAACAGKGGAKAVSNAAIRARIFRYTEKC